MQTTLNWLKENILAHLTLSVIVADGKVTVNLVDGRSYNAPCPDIKEAFTPVAASQEPEDRWPTPKLAPQPRGGSTDARLWGG